MPGMSAFDAICHSFATVAIGGFSTHDASIGFFNSPAIEVVACVFMVLSGINFALHFLVWRRRNLLLYFADYELRTYFLVLLFVSLTVVGILIGDNGNSSALRQGTFQAISFVTTTGFVTEDVAQWLTDNGRPALPYHAGLTQETRQLHQDRFLREDGLIICATVAFGACLSSEAAGDHADIHCREVSNRAQGPLGITADSHSR